MEVAGARGTVAYFLDTEGNVAGIRQPEKSE
jgi:hypothetical protein